MPPCEPKSIACACSYGATTKFLPNLRDRAEATEGDRVVMATRTVARRLANETVETQSQNRTSGEADGGAPSPVSSLAA